MNKTLIFLFLFISKAASGQIDSPDSSILSNGGRKQRYEDFVMKGSQSHRTKSDTTIQNKAQTIRNYFLPEKGKNYSHYYWPLKDGSPSGSTKFRYYKKKNNYMDVCEISSVNGEDIGDLTETIVYITDTEVKLIQINGDKELNEQISTLLNKPIDANTYYNPPKTLLKMPKEWQTITWQYNQEGGYKENNAVKFGSVIINGEKKKAIIVSQKITRPNGSSWGTTKTTYYVENIGYYMTKIGNQVLEILDSVSYDNSVETSKSYILESITHENYNIDKPVGANTSKQVSAKKSAFTDEELRDMSIVRISEPLNMDLISTELGIDKKLLTRWNPDYDLFVCNTYPTPYYSLRIPKNKVDAFLSKKDFLAKKSRRIFGKKI